MSKEKLTFKNDYKTGKNNEEIVYDLICKYWYDRNIMKCNDAYSNFDFYDEKYSYELKSRRIDHDYYPTTMIPEMKCHKHTILLFKFTNGLYYIRYRKSVFDEFEKEMFVKNRGDKIDVKKNYYYIPFDKLKKIELNSDKAEEKKSRSIHNVS